MKINKIRGAGFTLVETLVSILLLSVIMVVVGSAFVGTVKIQRRAINLQQAEENAHFTLESMIKEIRVSEVCPGNGPSGCDSACPAIPAVTLDVTHPVNGRIIYSLSGNAIHRNVNGVDTIISSNTVEFTRLQFCVLGSVFGNLQQPRVSIIASVRSAKTKEQINIDLQTSISQRFLND